MKCVAFFLLCLTAAPGCILEDKPVDPMVDASVDSGLCGGCGGETPVCIEDQGCVQCTENDDAYCVERMQVCKTGAFDCVACNTSADCNAPDAAHCNEETNDCEACESDADCDNVDGLPRCEMASALCVQCTPATEEADCGEKSCDPRTFACTNTNVGSVGTCEECVADSECGEDGNRCVAMTYQDEPYPDLETGFCLKTTEGGCQQPYSITLSARQSLSGPPADNYCGINEQLATCEAVRALVENQVCPSGEEDGCPQPSGLCRQVGDLQNRCTYPCASVVECLENDPVGRPGSTCGSSDPGGDDYCGG